MAIDILSVQPHKVSRSLEGYTIMFYGEPKSGKTTIASKFDKALILGFEIGYLAIPGVMAQPISRWSEFKRVIKQLKAEEAHEKFSTIVVDTADIAYDLCEKYICNKNEVSEIGDIPYGGGFAQASKEYDEVLRTIPQMGYGLVLISHSQDKTFKNEYGQEYNQIVPTLATRPRNIVDRMSDIIGYSTIVEDAEGNAKTVLYMRGTPRFIAGSRFKYTPDKIDFSYENLVNAIADAVDMQAKESGGELITDEKTTEHDVAPMASFEDQMVEFKKLVTQIQKNVGKDEFKNTWTAKITAVTDKYLGVGKKINDCTAAQSEQLTLILDDLKDLVGEGL